MDSSTAAASAERALLKNSQIKEEIRRLAGQKTSIPSSQAEIGNRRPQIEEDTTRSQAKNNIEEIRSSVARLSSRSVDGLERLKSELEELQKLLKSEVERVQAEINSALVGIKVIAEVIAPWKSSTSVSPMPSTGADDAPTNPEASLNGEPALSSA